MLEALRTLLIQKRFSDAAALLRSIEAQHQPWLSARALRLTATHVRTPARKARLLARATQIEEASFHLRPPISEPAPDLSDKALARALAQPLPLKR